MKNSWCAVMGLVFCVLAGGARGEVDAKLGAKLDAVLGSLQSTGANYVARVVEVSTGRELYLHEADRPVAPASNAKLANDAAGLDRFGPGYVWRTYLAMDGDDLWIIGTGDPACGDRRIEAAHGEKRMAMLDQWADTLAKRGVTHVKGKLLFDDGVFDDERVGSTWTKSEMTEWWSAPLSGLTLNGSCVEVNALPDGLEIIPVATGVKVIDQTHKAGAKEDLTLDRAADSDTFTVKGLLPTKKAKVDIKAIVDPGMFFADAVRTKFKEKGITIDGGTERATRDVAREKWGKLKESDQRDARVVATHETSMVDVLGRINKHSQNLFAEAICKLQGRTWNLEHGKDEPGSWKSGAEAVHAFLKRMEIDDSTYVLVDGSGLSADNRVTARLETDLLLKMLKHKYGKEYRASLSVCGVDGTLDDRMMELKGRVQGKSGSIDGVRALSGYVTTNGGETLVFTMIFNGLPEKMERKAVGVLDNAGRVLAGWEGK